MATDANINITSASLRGSPSDRIIKPRPRKDSLQSISGSDSVPGRIVKPRARKSPGSGAKRSEPAKRKFICSFSHYGCDVALSSKNEWKRHVSIQHLQLGFYRCDVGSCNPDLNPTVPGHKRVYNDFNRKDLFTQHHRRMHKPESGPGSGTFSTNASESNKEWRAFEDSLEEVRARCWKEKRKPPQRSTCGFCGRLFEGDGSWNERMEHVGGHFSREVVEAKEEREDEDLTNWALQEGILKETAGGRHVLVDQPPTAGERPYMSRDRDVNMADAYPDNIDPSIGTSEASFYQDSTSPHESRRMSNAFSASTTNGTPRPPSAPALGSPQTLAPGLPLTSALSGSTTAPILAPAPSPRSGPIAPPSPPERRNYNLAPPPLKSPTKEDGSGDRLEDLINNLIKPREPKLQRRLTWKCDCNTEMSVDVDETESKIIKDLQDISVICSKTSSAYLKAAKAEGKYNIIPCEELEAYVWQKAKKQIEKTGVKTATGNATGPVTATATTTATTSQPAS